MTVFAIPKINAYIVKKADAPKIINSKNSSSNAFIIRACAQKFKLNNLK